MSVRLSEALAGCEKPRFVIIYRWIIQNYAHASIASGCSKRPSSKAAASEEARRTLRYVEPLNDARTPLADFFSILLELNMLVDHRIKVSD